MFLMWCVDEPTVLSIEFVWKKIFQLNLSAGSMFTLVLTSLPLRPIVLSSKNSQLMRSILRFSSFIFRLHENYLLILRKSKMKLEFFGGMMKSISNEKIKIYSMAVLFM